MRKLIAGLILGATLTFIIGSGATNFSRLVLGDSNFGSDPNTTADITLQNDEYISNYVNGRIDFGAANLLTTGTLGAGASTVTSLASSGNVTFGVDSSKGIVLAASDSTLWRIKVSPTGAVSADSTGLN